MRQWFLIAAGLMLLSARPLFAASVSASMDVRAMVIGNCRVSVTDLSFGDYDPLGSHSQASLDASATLNLICTKDLAVVVSLDEGRHSTSARSGRQLELGTYRLDYQLYRDSARQAIWADGEFGERVAGTGLISSPVEVTVFGRIPGGQVVPAGAYTDVVTAKVDF